MQEQTIPIILSIMLILLLVLGTTVSMTSCAKAEQTNSTNKPNTKKIPNPALKLCNAGNNIDYSTRQAA